jgi:hypothetical protein
VKLEEIDGDVYMSQSLIEKSSAKTESAERGIVSIGNIEVGKITSISMNSSDLSQIEFEFDVDPFSFVMDAYQKKVKISGVNSPYIFTIYEIRCDIETKRCALSTIHSKSR